MQQGDSRTRKITYYSQAVDDLYYERERVQPTQKQKRFLKQLICRCKEHDVDYSIGRHLATRGDYADAIGELIQRLDDAGAPVKKSEEEFERLLIFSDDPETGRVVKERLVPKTDKRKYPAVEYAEKAAKRALRWKEK